MGRKKESDEVKVKRVYPDAVIFETYPYFTVCICESPSLNSKRISARFDNPDLAWSDALRQINAAKKKSYYKHKIKRPNNEKKAKVNIMLYPSDKTAIIGKYGSVQKFINHSVEQIKTK